MTPKRDSWESNFYAMARRSDELQSYVSELKSEARSQQQRIDSLEHQLAAIERVRYSFFGILGERTLNCPGGVPIGWEVRIISHYSGTVTYQIGDVVGFSESVIPTTSRTGHVLFFVFNGESFTATEVEQPATTEQQLAAARAECERLQKRLAEQYEAASTIHAMCLNAGCEAKGCCVSTVKELASRLIAAENSRQSYVRSIDQLRTELAAANERAEAAETRFRRIIGSVVRTLRTLKHKRVYSENDCYEPGPLDSPVLWGKVAYVCGLGSTSATALCRELGLNPDTGESDV